MANRKHGNSHHLIPSSRISKNLNSPNRTWNIKKKTSVKQHRAYHLLFNNRLPCEAIEMIKNKRIKKRYGKNRLNRRNRQKIKAKEKAWIALFNGSAEKKAIQIIMEEWTPKHPRAKCFSFKECEKFYNPKKICPLLTLDKKGEFYE